jgi:hypothetical protein
MKTNLILGLLFASTMASSAALVSSTRQFVVTSSSHPTGVFVSGDTFSFVLNYEDTLTDSHLSGLTTYNATGVFGPDGGSNINLSISKVSGSGSFTGTIIQGTISNGVHRIETNLDQVVFDFGSSNPSNTTAVITYSKSGVITDSGTGQTIRNQLGNQDIDQILWNNISVVLSSQPNAPTSWQVQGRVSNIPEPSTLSVLSLALLGVFKRRRS